MNSTVYKRTNRIECIVYIMDCCLFVVYTFVKTACQLLLLQSMTASPVWTIAMMEMMSGILLLLYPVQCWWMMLVITLTIYLLNNFALLVQKAQLINSCVSSESNETEHVDCGNMRQNRYTHTSYRQRGSERHHY